MREQQLADLTRGYEQSKANYDELLKKKNESAMATSMEQLQQGERFRMLDPPSLPLKPDFPNRLKFCGIGLGVGLVLGVVVAGAFEMMDDRLYSEKEIKELLPVAVISEIPEILTASDEQERTRRMWWDGRWQRWYLPPSWRGPRSAICTAKFSQCTKPFFDLTRNPFELTPDPAFLFPTRRHNEALAALYYGVRRHKGIYRGHRRGRHRENACCFDACFNC